MLRFTTLCVWQAMTDVNPLLERIDQRLETLGLNDRAASMKATGKPDAIRNIRRGRLPRADTLDRLATALMCSSDWLLGKGDDATPTDTRTGPSPQPLRPQPDQVPDDRVSPSPARVITGDEGGQRSLPILGIAVAGKDGFFELNGEVHGYVERPSALYGVDDAYALYVEDESMVPRYMPGEIIFVHPRRPITRDCFVVVQFRPEEDGQPPRALVKQYVKRSAAKLSLREYNPEVRLLTFPLGSLLSMHRIIRGGEE